MVAVVIMAETLLAENNFAFKNGYKLNDRQEILACAAGNIAASAVGCCPVNGSISRTSMNEQYGGTSQAVSLTAGLVMAVLLAGFTGFIGYLAVPVLTAIVISALMDVVETHLAVRLFKVSRNEFYIFMAACLGVLFLGTDLRRDNWNPSFLCFRDPQSNQPAALFPRHDPRQRSLL